MIRLLGGGEQQVDAIDPSSILLEHRGVLDGRLWWFGCEDVACSVADGQVIDLAGHARLFGPFVHDHAGIVFGFAQLGVDEGAVAVHPYFDRGGCSAPGASVLFMCSSCAL